MRIYLKIYANVNKSQPETMFMEELVQLTIDLMRFRTTENNFEEISKCGKFIIDYLTHKDIVIKKYEYKGKVSIVTLFKNTKAPKIFLNAHFDVVPASAHSFAPRVEGDKLYGRGSSDCKGQVALLMKLMKDFAGKKNKPNIGLMLTSDEEVHGNAGVKYLLNDQGYKCEFVIVADGGDDYDIVTKHKGVLQVKMSAHGKSAHSSRYWDGENAIETLMRAYQRVVKIYPKLKAGAWKTTVNLSKIKGGDTLNKVPDYAELCLDIRWTDSKESVLKKLGEIPDVDIEVLATADMLITDDNNPYIKKLQASAEKVLKRKVRTSYEHGATDARYFSAKGIPAVLFKPLGFGAHSETEYLVISSLKPFYKIMVDFLNAT